MAINNSDLAALPDLVGTACETLWLVGIYIEFSADVCGV